jgi:hypothetical protein
VEQAVAPFRAKYPVEVAFGMADATSLQAAVRGLEARDVRRIGVVRLFVSGESWLERTEQILGMREGAPAQEQGDAHAGHGAANAHAGHGGHDAHAGHAAPANPHAGHAAPANPHAGHAAPANPHAGHAAPANPHAGHGAPADPHAAHGAAAHGGHSMAFFRVETSSKFELTKDGLADAAGMGAVIADRARALSKTPATEDVLILAHGPGDDAENTRWLAKLDERAAAVRTAAPFRRVHVETLREDWPDKRVDAEKRIRDFVTRAKTEGGTAIVIPFRVQGFGPYAKVLEGLDYVSDGTGLIPHDQVGAWISTQIEELATRTFDGAP